MWVYWAFVPAAVLHIVEEYGWPGGFVQFIKRFNPRLAPGVTTGFAVLVNGLFLVMCLAAALLVSVSPLFSLSVAGLLFVNGLVHLVTTVHLRVYAPGLVSGVLLYWPLAALAYSRAFAQSWFTPGMAFLSLIIGLFYNLLPTLYLLLSSRLRHAERM